MFVSSRHVSQTVETPALPGGCRLAVGSGVTLDLPSGSVGGEPIIIVPFDVRSQTSCPLVFLINDSWKWSFSGHKDGGRGRWAVTGSSGTRAAEPSNQRL